MTKLIRANAVLYLSIRTFNWHIVVSRPGKGFAAGRDLANTEAEPSSPPPSALQYIVSHQSGLSAVVVYRTGCAIAINSKR
jgi:hypothetical protein